MIKLLHSFQRFSNTRVDAILVVIFLVVFQIICSLIFGTLGISIISNFQMVKSYIGSLHTPEVIEKFRKLGASQEVLLVLQQGLYMPYEDSMIPKNEFFTHNKGDSTCLSSSACHISSICQIRIGRAGDEGQVWTQRPTSKIESSPTNKLRSGS